MTPIFKAIALLGLIIGMQSPVFGQADAPLEDALLEAKARALMEEIRCVVCQNQSIVDSNAEIASDLRRIVRARVQAGETPEAIKAFLVERYGDWVLLKPPLNTGTIILWASPFLFILVAGFILISYRKNQTKAVIAEPLSDEEAKTLEKLLSEENDQEPKA
jgi:cytochrome c-type biogenesis protein CcmH